MKRNVVIRPEPFAPTRKLSLTVPLLGAVVIDLFLHELHCIYISTQMDQNRRKCVSETEFALF